jgi:hypothetical protein
MTTTAGCSLRDSCRFASCFGFADHFDVGFVFEQGSKAFPDNLVIFSQQDSNAFHI